MTAMSDMHPAHDAGVVHHDETGYRAECVCGWTSEPVPTSERAEHEQWQHGVAHDLMDPSTEEL